MSEHAAIEVPAVAGDVPVVDYDVRTVTVGGCVLSAGRTRGRGRLAGVEAERYEDGSWSLEVHALGWFAGLYR